jgi:hypothetical protein
MSMERWEDHGNWEEQLFEFMREQLNIDEMSELDDELKYDLANIAAKVMRGDMDIAWAVRQIGEILVSRMLGYKWLPDEESFNLEMAFGELVEVTDIIQTYLLTAGEPGLADAMLRVYVHPALAMAEAGEALVGETPGEMAAGFCTKAWFSVDRLNPTERTNLHWAMIQAAKERVGAN